MSGRIDINWEGLARRYETPTRLIRHHTRATHALSGSTQRQSCTSSVSDPLSRSLYRFPPTPSARTHLDVSAEVTEHVAATSACGQRDAHPDLPFCRRRRIRTVAAVHWRLNPNTGRPGFRDDATRGAGRGRGAGGAAAVALTAAAAATTAAAAARLARKGRRRRGAGNGGGKGRAADGRHATRRQTRHGEDVGLVLEVVIGPYGAVNRHAGNGGIAAGRVCTPHHTKRKGMSMMEANRYSPSRSRWNGIRTQAGSTLGRM
mgnify:CR=1 FL=1